MNGVMARGRLATPPRCVITTGFGTAVGVHRRPARRQPHPAADEEVRPSTSWSTASPSAGTRSAPIGVLRRRAPLVTGWPTGWTGRCPAIDATAPPCVVPLAPQAPHPPGEPARRHVEGWTDPVGAAPAGASHRRSGPGRAVPAVRSWRSRGRPAMRVHAGAWPGGHRVVRRRWDGPGPGTSTAPRRRGRGMRRRGQSRMHPMFVQPLAVNRWRIVDMRLVPVAD